MKKAIQFGAGNIGRGFIGMLLEKSGYHVIFADVNMDVINKINTDKSYTVHIMDVECKDEPITNISAISSMSDDIIKEFTDVEIVTTAVGLTILPRIAPTIAKGIQARKNAGIQSTFNIIACENAIKASSQLKTEVCKLLSQEDIAYLEEYVGFPDCSVDRIVPPVKSENFIDVVVENYFEWNVEKSAFRGDIPHIEGMNLAEHLMSYIERKLFTLNTGHAITAYLGYLKGLPTIESSIADTQIYSIVKSAMQESGMGLIKKYNFDKTAHFAYIEKIIKRFQNPYLNDDVARVGREPMRKLSPDDRLIKPATTADSFGLPIEHLLLGIGAALHYNNKDDQQSITLNQMLQEKGMKKVLQEVSNINPDSVLSSQIEDAYKKIDNMFN